MSKNFIGKVYYFSIFKFSLLFVFIFLFFPFHAFADISQTDNSTEGGVIYAQNVTSRLYQFLGSSLSGTLTSVQFYVSPYNAGGTVQFYPHLLECTSNPAPSSPTTNGSNIDVSSCSDVSNVGFSPITRSNTGFATWTLSSPYTLNYSDFYYIFFDNPTSNGLNDHAAYFYGTSTSHYPSSFAFWGGLNSSDGTGGRGVVGDIYYVAYGIGQATTTISSDITSNTIWSPPTVYTVSKDITVNSGVTLTIEPGTFVKFATTTSSSITVNGTLNSIGDVTTSTHLGAIFLISANNTSLGTPSVGDWGGIIINSGGTVNFSYVTIRYGGNATSSDALIFNNGGTVSISSSTIAYSDIYGIKNSSGTTTVTSSDVGFNDYGLYLGGGSISITATSTIHDNTSYGIYNNTTNTIDAENNWWVSSDGPYNAGGNPGGTGDHVSDYVDFTPWIEILHYTSGTGAVNTGAHEIRWDGSTTYSTEFYNAVATWNALGSINIATSTGSTDLSVSDANFSDVPWVGLYNPNPNPNTLQINGYYASHYPSSIVQNAITHELGHALGLQHSYTGNVMYFQVTPQTTLGVQDVYDYYFLWP